MLEVKSLEDVRRVLSAERWWQLQILGLIAGDRPDEVAAWVRSRVALFKQLSPPDPEEGAADIKPADYDRFLLEVFPHIEEIGGVFAEDLERHAEERAGDGSSSASADRPIEQLLGVLQDMQRRNAALQYWLTQSYLLMSGGNAGMMAHRIDGKLQALKTEPPTGPERMSSAELDARMVEEMPMILQVGAEMAEQLRGTQRLIDQRRAQAG
jgi:hypothetical protein